MVGRKGPKAGQKKLKASNDLAAKTMKKLKKRRPENALDPNAATHVKQLVVDVRGQQKTRLEKRYMAQTLAGQASLCSEIILLLRDGLLQRRLQGMTMLYELIKSSPTILLTAGQRLLKEVGPRLTDDECTARRYAMQIIIDCVKCAHEVAHGPVTTLEAKTQRCEWKAFFDAVSATIIAQLRTCLTNLQRSKCQDGILYAYLTAASPAGFILASTKFVTQVLPLVFGHSNQMLLPAGKIAAKSSQLTTFDNALVPMFSRNAGLYMAALLKCFALIASGNVSEHSHEVDDLLWDQFSTMLKSPKVEVEKQTRSDAKKVVTSRDDFATRKQPGADYHLGALVRGVRGMLAALEDMSRATNEAVNQKVILIATTMLRWVIGLLEIEERHRLDDIASSTTATDLPLTRLTKLLTDTMLKKDQQMSQYIDELQLIDVVLLLAKLKPDESSWYVDYSVASAIKSMTAFVNLTPALREKYVTGITQLGAVLSTLKPAPPRAALESKSGYILIQDTHHVLSRVFGLPKINV